MTALVFAPGRDSVRALAVFGRCQIIRDEEETRRAPVPSRLPLFRPR